MRFSLICLESVMATKLVGQGNLCGSQPWRSSPSIGRVVSNYNGPSSPGSARQATSETAFRIRERRAVVIGTTTGRIGFRQAGRK